MSHSFLYFIIRAGNGVFAIATLAVFTRLLSPSEYGVYAIGMSIATVASTILFQWLSVATARFYPMHIDDPGKVMGVAVSGFWVATVASAVLFSFGALTFHKVLTVDLAWGGIVFLIAVALGRHSLALQQANSQSCPIRYGLLSWAKGGGALFSGFLLIYYGMGARGALLGFFAGLVFAVIAFALKTNVRMKLGSGDKELSVEMYRYGVPVTLNFFAILIVDLADRFMIGKLLGVVHVASYVVAYDLVQLSVGPVMNVLFLTAFPLIVKEFEGGGLKLARIRLSTLGSRLISCGLPFAVGVGVLASDIAGIILGNDYHQVGGAIIPWLGAAIFVGACKSYYFDVIFQLHHANKIQGCISILMALVNIVLNLLLLPRFGVIAAAWSTLAAFIVGALVSWFAGKTLFALPSLGKVFRRSACASAIMACVLYLLPGTTGVIWLLAKIQLGFVIYVAMALVLDLSDCRKLIVSFISQHNR